MLFVKAMLVTLGAALVAAPNDKNPGAVRSTLPLAATCVPGRGGAELCSAWTLGAPTQVLERPEPTAQEILKLGRARRLYLVGIEDGADAPGWVQVQWRSDPGNQLRRGWAKRSELVLATEFLRVVDCWPVQYLKWTEASPYSGSTPMMDPPTALSLDRRGHGSVDMPQYSEGSPTSADVAVFYASGAFLLRGAKAPWGEVVNPAFHLDLRGKRVTIAFEGAGAFGDPPYEFRPAKDLVGCGAVPTTDAAQPLLRGTPSKP